MNSSYEFSLFFNFLTFFKRKQGVLKLGLPVALFDYPQDIDDANSLDDLSFVKDTITCPTIEIKQRKLRWTSLNKFLPFFLHKRRRLFIKPAGVQFSTLLFFKNFFFFQFYNRSIFFKKARTTLLSRAVFTFFFLKKKKTNLLFFFFVKKNDIVFMDPLRFNNFCIEDASDSLPLSLLKQPAFLKLFLMVYSFFFKTKNFLFLNNFFIFYNFLPAELTISFFNFKNLQLEQDYGLQLSSRQFSYPWLLFFFEDSLFLEKKSYLLTFFYSFLTSYAECLLFSKVAIRIKNCSFGLRNNMLLINWIAARALPRFRKFCRTFFFFEFLDILILSFIKKDIKFFEYWFVRFFEGIQFKFHKSFLFLFNKFLKEFFPVFRRIFLVRGFKLDVRGKVSVAGNSKKRHYLIKYGELSFSKKNNKISYAQNIVRTPTGVLGLEFVLVY